MDNLYRSRYPSPLNPMSSSHAPQNFLGLEKKFSTYSKSKVVIIPAPFEASTSYQQGTVNGPKSVIKASTQVELYDIELDKSCHTVGIHTLPSLPIEKTPAEKAAKILYQETKKVLKDNKWPVMIGGEHAISYGFFKALLEKHPHLSIFHIDAHTDMRAAYEGNPYSHASILYLMRQSCPRSVSIGVRSMCEEEAEYVKKNKVPVYYDYQIHKEGLNPKKLFHHLTHDVYLTIDVDGFSPEIIPSTGTPEPGGLKWYETLTVLKQLFKEKNVIGMDMVEHMPIPNVLYGDFSVAKLIYKCIGYKYYQ